MARLFPQSLRGVGTHDIESLSSYICRLANSHGVTTQNLLESTFDWYVLDNNIHDHDMPSYDSCGKLNVLVRPNRLSSLSLTIIEHATGEKNLKSSTFFSLSEALDRSVNTFSSQLRWCPACMWEFKKADDPGYFKLLWSLKDISHCPEHRVALIDKCPYCDAYQDSYGFKPICRKCRRCGGPLGKPIKQHEVHTSWDLQGFDLVKLVEVISKDRNLVFPKDGIKNLISTIFDNAWKHGDEELLWKKIPRDECLALTCGNAAVTLTIARRFAARLGVELYELLSGEIDTIPGILEPEWFKGIPKNLQPKKRASRHNRDEVFDTILRNISSNESPLPLVRLANICGVSTGYLHYHFPELSAKVISEHKAWKKEQMAQKRRNARELALDYFTTSNDPEKNVSRKHAQRVLREKTGLPKNILREEINAVYKLLF